MSGPSRFLTRTADGRYAHARSADSGVRDDIPGCQRLILDLDALCAELDEHERPDA